MKTFDALTDAQIDAKIEHAARTFQTYRRTPLAERAGRMLRAAEILEAEQGVFGRMMTTEMGKLVKAGSEEAAKCAWGCRFYAEHAARMLADEPVQSTATKSFVRYQPLGPILAVMPWNFPFWQVFRLAAPALMAGNVVLLKHASNVPQCALMIEDIIRRAGFPDGAFQTLLIRSGPGPARARRSARGGRFADGQRAGRPQVAGAAGRQIKKTVLELGGSDPFIVMPSADMRAAIETAVKARVVNSGQSCIAAKRFIVAEAVADAFERGFTEKMRALKVGDPLDPPTEVGPLATRAVLTDLDDQVRRSVAAGARVLTGGQPLDRPGNYYAPTVLTDIKPGSPAYNEELFGPVAALFRVRDIDEAIRLANDTSFGLGSSVPFGFGGANLGNLYRAMSDDHAHAVLDAAWNAGIRHFDTAPHYGLGLSERRLGAFLAGKPRAEYVLSTKVGRLLRPTPERAGRTDDAHGFAVPAAFERVWDSSADGVRRSLDESLRRLGLDRVDVLYLHDPDESGTDLDRRWTPACRRWPGCARPAWSRRWASAPSRSRRCSAPPAPGCPTCSWWPAATRCWSSRRPPSCCPSAGRGTSAWSSPGCSTPGCWPPPPRSPEPTTSTPRRRPRCSSRRRGCARCAPATGCSCRWRPCSSRCASRPSGRSCWAAATPSRWRRTWPGRRSRCPRRSGTTSRPRG